jgi:hypothetical protein
MLPHATAVCIDFCHVVQGKVDLQLKNASFKASYEHLFGPNDGQEAICNSVHQVVEDAMAGYNASIIAYGQTGTGKTYTMMGTEASMPLGGASCASLLQSHTACTIGVTTCHTAP